MRAVSIANRYPRLRFDRRAVVRAIHTLDANFFPTKSPGSPSPPRSPRNVFSPPLGELSLVFLSDPALIQLHADFLADPTPTDVITFTGDQAHSLAGEICVSVDAARRQVPPRRRSAASRHHAFSLELTLYLVHGWLHLAGYDDLVPTKKRAMRRAEKRAMRLLLATGQIPAFSFRDD